MVTFAGLGILNVHVCNPIERENEFIIQLVKLGEPKFSQPPLQSEGKALLARQNAVPRSFFSDIASRFKRKE
jgi:hypothetical protein